MKPKFNLKKIFQPQYLIIAILVFLILILALKSPTDPDMGWHLRDGQYFLEHHSLPKTDPFSHSMADFPVVAHSWLTDIIMYLIYHYAGFFALSVVFAVITCLAFFIAARALGGKIEYSLLAVLLAVIASMPIIGARAQMVSLLFLSLVIVVLFRFKQNPKSRLIFWLPVIFLVWVNFHGGFVLGLAVVGIILACEGLKFILHRYRPGILAMKKSKWWLLAAMSGLSVVATFVNPYFWRIYVEVFNTLHNPVEKTFISEWQSVDYHQPMSYQFIVFVVLLGFLILLYVRKIDLTYLILLLVIFVVSITSWRNMTLLALISLPLWVMIVDDLAGKALVEYLRNWWLVGLFAIFLIAIIGKNLLQVWDDTKNIQNLSKAGSFPYNTVQYLKSHPIPPGNVYNDYNVGGYLIWQLPQVKVFIDGRMPTFIMPNRHILADYRDIDSVASDWQTCFNKYHFSWAIIHQGGLLIPNLEHQNWREIYQDDQNVILVKPSTSS